MPKYWYLYKKGFFYLHCNLRPDFRHNYQIHHHNHYCNPFLYQYPHPYYPYFHPKCNLRFRNPLNSYSENRNFRYLRFRNPHFQSLHSQNLSRLRYLLLMPDNPQVFLHNYRHGHIRWFHHNRHPHGIHLSSFPWQPYSLP